jgi:hypothetical protein
MLYRGNRKLRFADLNVGDFFVFNYELNKDSEYCPVLEKTTETTYNITRYIDQLKFDNRSNNKRGKRIVKLNGSCHLNTEVQFVDKNEM